MHGPCQRFEYQRSRDHASGDRRREIFQHVEDAAARKVEQAAAADRLRGPARAVERTRRAEKNTAPAAGAGALREVEILVIDEEPFIESAQLEEQAAPDEAKRPHDLVDRP